MDIIISNSSDTPIYAQIVQQIKNMIMDGQLQEGDPLPSIRALAVGLKISSITTKRAYEELEREGYIVSSVGRGTFVSAQNKALLQEKRMKIVEEKLAEGVKAAKLINMPLEEIITLVKILYEEE